MQVKSANSPAKSEILWDFAHPVDQFELSEPRPSLVPPRVQSISTWPIALQPQRQHGPLASGQASVAMALTHLTGQSWSCQQVADVYGGNLLGALEEQTKHLRLSWNDIDFSPSAWAVIEKQLGRGRPVLMGLNGPLFSPTADGHVVTLLGIQGELVHFADPASGKVRCQPKYEFERAPGHPIGKFVLYASKPRPR